MRRTEITAVARAVFINGSVAVTVFEIVRIKRTFVISRPVARTVGFCKGISVAVIAFIEV